ncbi:pyruvate dehydrogenase E1 component alpha subunit [Melghiribacillus thermohalophilus]|uniref:Pyruvate dehydrogenase E1 component alpha subunit n=1 Tax=Melghiribacillus thermohalophilus TaxID=1324956 RepID=A0A4R3N1H5_9BACI|nr:thiamine pyrophosphate-dependent dehydrogenase E1 component subunit alpha [Melghiribacillus thermohalophilus]TCT21766.1 pyruvate dehydrogenase E1 component alpha subunit [Melghiribacillus thermohalophilus]
MEIPKEKLIWMYETMVKSRYFEEQMEQAYMEGKAPAFNIGAGPVPGEMHLSNGQEPAAVGICAHLTDDDTVTSPHRPHHHAIAKGVDLKKMTAEIFGKVTGLGKGKGGHMHLFDPSVKFSCGGIVGAGIPHAVGAVLTAKKRGTDDVAVAFIGEGAANSGAFHESLNLAALWNLPLIVVVEDNKYGISVTKESSTAVESNDLRAPAYGIAGEKVKDNDPMAMYEASKRAVERTRAGEGPAIIEIETYRYLGHFQGDPELYRPEGEADSLREKDPIIRLKNYMLEQNLYTEEELTEREETVKNEVDQAFEFARNSADPAPEDALQDVFAE